MRNVWRIFRDDLRQSVSSIVAVLIVVGLCLAPALYAWVSIAGNWNPLANTGQLKVAVANGDEGYESSLMPVRLNVGDRIVGVLRDNEAFDWVFVDERSALDGVRSGEYYAAISIPHDYSAKTMASLSSEAEQVSVAFYLNTMANPDAPVLADMGGSQVDEGILSEFSKAVDDMSLDLAADLVSFAGGSNAREFGARLIAHLDDVAVSLDTTAEQVRSFASLADGASSLAAATDEGLEGSEDVAGAAGKVVEEAAEVLDAAVGSAQSASWSIQQQVQAARDSGGLGEVGTETASQLATDAASLANSIDTITRESEALAAEFKEVAKSLSEDTSSVTNHLNAVRNQLGISANKLNASAAKVRKFQEDAASAIAKGDLSAVATIVGSKKAAFAQLLAEPVKVEEHAVYSAESFGSLVTPFYTVIALWIGAVLLVLVLSPRLSRERFERYEAEGGRPVKSLSQYFGRFLVVAVLALVQATLIGLGDLLFLRVSCENPLLFLVACWVCSLAFGCLAYTLSVLFGGVGKALCVVLLAVQVLGAGVVFPAQMLGDVFPIVNLALPTTYGAHSLQAAIVGLYDTEYAFDLLRLGAFFAGSLIVGLALCTHLGACRRKALHLSDSEE